MFGPGPTMGSAPTQLVEPIVIDSNVVGKLVNNRDENFVAELVEVFRILTEREAVEGDAVGER